MRSANSGAVAAMTANTLADLDARGIGYILDESQTDAAIVPTSDHGKCPQNPGI